MANIKLKNVHSLLNYIICFFLIYIQYMHSAIALDNSSSHLKNLPDFLPFRKPFDNIEKIIRTDNFRSFDLDKRNKLYTNAHNSISLVNIINKIILAQDNLFILESKPYNIVLVDNPNLSRTTGAAGKDYVIIEGSLKKNIKDYTRVISHELIHRYIGHIIEQDNDKKNEIKYKWFFEGFTEFYGVKTLLDTKLIDKDEYLKIINITLKEYFNSLIPNIDFEKINQKHLLDQNISMLSYNRGFILAMIIDEKLNEVSNGRYNLLTTVNSIISEITSKQVNFNVDLFASHLKHYLPESFIKDIVASIRDSSILLSLLPSRLLNKNLTFQDTDKYSDICFNLTRSLELQKIRGVKLGSDCHNMGLKNGQELKCYSIDFNSGNIKLKVLENKIPKVIHLKANKITSSTPIYK